MKKKKLNENQFRVLLFLCSLGVKGEEKQKTKRGSHRQCSGLGLYPGHGL